MCLNNRRKQLHFECILDFLTCMYFLKHLKQWNYYSRFYLDCKQNFLFEISDTIDISHTHERTNQSKLRWYGTLPSYDLLSFKLNNENSLYLIFSICPKYDNSQFKQKLAICWSKVWFLYQWLLIRNLFYILTIIVSSQKWISFRNCISIHSYNVFRIVVTIYIE